MDNQQERSFKRKSSETNTLGDFMNKKLDAQWIAGFTDGEGCFAIEINKQQNGSEQVLLSFTVTQHSLDIQTLYKLKEFFGVGIIRQNHAERFCYRVRSQKHLRDHIIPFFEKHRLKTTKNIDFVKFRYVLTLMERKRHLTPEGRDQIRKIRNTMNRRKYSEYNAYLNKNPDKLVQLKKSAKIKSSS